MAAKYTFSRSSPAYLSDGTQVAADTPRFEQGKFGKAVLVEEGTTNIGSPASLFDDSWVRANGTSTILDAYTRKYTFFSTPVGAFAYKTFTLTTGVAYTWSAEIKGEGSTVGKQVCLQSSAESVYGTPVTLTTEWQRVTLTFTATATSRAVGFIGIPVNAFASGDVVYIRNFQWEQKPYATSFIDGTRAAETLTIPTEGVLNDRGPWTVECWAKANYSGSSYRMPFAAWNKFYVSLNLSDKPQFSWLDANNVQQIAIATNALNNPTGWHYWAFTWDGVTARIYVDGVKVIEVETDLPKPLPVYLTVGWGAGGYYWNGLIDDLRISNRARTDEEILAAYEAGGPLPVDGDTTLKLNFDPSDNADIMIYNDGLVLPFYIQETRDTKRPLIAPTRDAVEEKDAADGEIEFETTLGVGEFTLHGIAEFNSIEERNAIENRIRQQLNDCRTTKQLALESDPEKCTFVRLTGKPDIRRHPRHLEVIAQFKADPFWYSGEEHFLIGSGTLTNAGTTDTSLVIEIAGPAENPSVVIGEHTLAYNGTVPSGQKLIIDTEHQTAKLNNANALDKYNGVFPKIPPGDTNVTAGSNVTIKWRDRWV